jgi:hypothetical protein
VDPSLFVLISPPLSLFFLHEHEKLLSSLFFLNEHEKLPPKQTHLHSPHISSLSHSHTHTHTHEHEKLLPGEHSSELLSGDLLPDDLLSGELLSGDLLPDDLLSGELLHGQAPPQPPPPQ